MCVASLVPAGEFHDVPHNLGVSGGRLRMAAGRISDQVKTMHGFITALEPGGTMDPNPATNLSCGFNVGIFQASQT